MSDLKAEASPRTSLRYQLDTGLAHLSPAERAARGADARAAVPREAHASFDPGPSRPDPIALLAEQATSRVPELVPVRWGRMMVSPFTYYRGAALGSILALPPGTLTQRTMIYAVRTHPEAPASSTRGTSGIAGSGSGILVTIPRLGMVTFYG